ncbi:MAG TPA: DMT family transporter [Casimicrobiaceae bacterium]|nr:DMT family transporter [Casimicrobiaceae bacterium]
MTVTAGSRQATVPLSAILMICGSVLCFTVLDSITKFTSQLYPVPLLVWARYIVQLVIVMIWLGHRAGARVFRTRNLQLHLIRGTMVLASSLAFVTALRSLPLAEATALVYSSPLLVVVMAWLFLNERVTRPRIAFVLAGAAGMLLIVRPGTEVFQAAALYALAAAAFYAVYQILTRKMAGEDPRSLLLYPAVVGSVIMTGLAPTFEWPSTMPWHHVALIVGGAMCGTFGHFLLIKAFTRGPASALTPYNYMQLVWATLIGWGVYGSFPDPWSLAGMAVIAGAGLLIALQEQRRRAPAPVHESVAVD